MSNYSPIVNYAPKDALTPGDPAKKILGVELAAEFTSIGTMSSSKQDTSAKGAANGYAPLDASVLLADAYLTTNIPRLNAASTIFTGSIFQLNNNAPTFQLRELDSAADEKVWRIDSIGSDFRMSTRTDADGAGTSWCLVARTGTTVDSITFTANLLTIPAPTRAQSGSAGTPSYSFTAAPDMGMYLIGTNAIGFSVGGSQVVMMSDATMRTTFQIQGPVGSASSPTFSYTSDSDTGIYFPTTNELGFSLGGEALLVGFRNIPQNAQAGNYTLLLTDSGRHIYHASGAGAGDTYTIPSNASVAYPIGTVLSFVNGDSNSVSIAITSDTMTLAATTTTGTRTLAQNGVATAIKTTSTGWIISGTGLS